MGRIVLLGAVIQGAFRLRMLLLTFHSIIVFTVPKLCPRPPRTTQNPADLVAPGLRFLRLSSDPFRLMPGGAWLENLYS